MTAWRQLQPNLYECDCGRRIVTRSTEKLDQTCNRVCQRNGLGNRVAAVLAWFGITQARYIAARGRYRVVGGAALCVLVELPPDEPATCQCDARREWLNKVGGMVVNRLWG